MSQAGIINTSSGPVPPSVATSYTTDNGTAVPVANILDIRGIDNSTAFINPNTNLANNNNPSGIIVIGGATQTGAVNRVDVQLSNRLHGTATTTDATTQQAFYTFLLGSVPGTYFFQNYLTYFDVTDQKSGAAIFYTCVRTNGISVGPGPNVFFVGDSKSFDAFEPGLGTVVFQADFSVISNAYRPYVTGLVGKTIDWQLVTTYNFVS